MTHIVKKLIRVKIGIFIIEIGEIYPFRGLFILLNVSEPSDLFFLVVSFFSSFRTGFIPGHDLKNLD